MLPLRFRRFSSSNLAKLITIIVFRISHNVINGGCTGINSQTLNLLKGGAVGGGVSVDRIGVYGNSNPSNLSQWVPLLGEGDAPSSSGVSYMYCVYSVMCIVNVYSVHP